MAAAVLAQSPMEGVLSTAGKRRPPRRGGRVASSTIGPRRGCAARGGRIFHLPGDTARRDAHAGTVDVPHRPRSSYSRVEQVVLGERGRAEARHPRRLPPRGSRGGKRRNGAFGRSPRPSPSGGVRGAGLRLGLLGRVARDGGPQVQHGGHPRGCRQSKTRPRRPSRSALQLRAIARVPFLPFELGGARPRFGLMWQQLLRDSGRDSWPRGPNSQWCGLCCGDCDGRICGAGNASQFGFAMAAGLVCVPEFCAWHAAGFASTRRAVVCGNFR
mmetsp:Transcript_50564/g.141609  ORF Transcript_50564/g.141609 Transcript_50564/m.141609 type:complete len:272 (+) Transcript_50564:131-946(+)